MLTARAAALRARQYFASLVGTGVLGLSVEEVELSSDGKWWLITLGYFQRPVMTVRQYKQFRVHAESGGVVSMKIRTF